MGAGSAGLGGALAGALAGAAMGASLTAEIGLASGFHAAAQAGASGFLSGFGGAMLTTSIDTWASGESLGQTLSAGAFEGLRSGAISGASGFVGGYAARGVFVSAFAQAKCFLWREAVSNVVLGVISGMVEGGVQRGIAGYNSTGSIWGALEGAQRGAGGGGQAGLAVTLPGSLAGLSKACFASGAPLLTPDGWKRIEDFAVGDLILGRNENDPTAPVVARPVLQLFTRTARIMQLTVQGVAVQTTGEHPFFVLGHGWLPANELKPGDFLATATDAWVRVDSVDPTEVWGTVHNLEVAEDHTYFVGRSGCGFAVWAHNACTQAEFEAALRTQGYSQKAAATAWNKFKLGEPTVRDLQGLHKYLTGRNEGGRTKLTGGQADAIVDMVASPPRAGAGGARPTWWDGGMSPVGGHNPNGLRQRPVDGPTPGEGGVYLKPEGGRTKVGSTDDYASRYGRSGPDGIEVEIPQTRIGKPAGVDDSAYPWSARGQRRFDEEYIDRMLSPEVRYRDPTNPKSPVTQEKWNRYRHIFGYGDLPENFGY